MKILVTGGSGMLGSAILRMYHEDHELSFVARNTEIAQELEQRYGVKGYILDLNDCDALIKACKDIDAIIHCAALSSPWGTYDQFYQGNVVSTQNIIEAARINQVSTIVHISTTSVYFDHSDRWAIEESEPLADNFCNDYALTKYLSEQVVLDSEVKSLILRPRGIFGPNDRAIIPRLLENLRSQRLFLPSSRNPVVDLTYVDNVAYAAMLACCNANELDHGEIFNISNGEPMPIEATLKLLFGSLKLTVSICTLPYPLLCPFLMANEWVRCRLPSYPEPNLTNYSAGLFHYHQTLDISKAQRLLGYQPRLTIKQGIEQYAKWFKSQNI